MRPNTRAKGAELEHKEYATHTASPIISLQVALKIQEHSTPLQTTHDTAVILVTSEPEATRQSLKQ